jgi:predicted dithiol-disulfide oxidoreductase (DUF899 family)
MAPGLRITARYQWRFSLMGIISNSSTQIVDLQEIRAKKEELLAKQLEEEKQREDVAQKRAFLKIHDLRRGI